MAERELRVIGADPYPSLSIRLLLSSERRAFPRPTLPHRAWDPRLRC